MQGCAHPLHQSERERGEREIKRERDGGRDRETDSEKDGGREREKKRESESISF
jgi:hypothetical protein